MIKFIQHIHPVIFAVVATVFEVSGDAILRKCIYEYTGVVRAGFFMTGALLLFCYGFVLNLTPVTFGQVVGIYIACLFIVWQVGNYIAFKTTPTLPMMVGGLLIIAGGLVITFWKN